MSLESSESSSPLITRAVAAGLPGRPFTGYSLSGWQRQALSLLGRLPQDAARRVVSAFQALSGLDAGQVIKIDELILDLNSYEVAIQGKRIYLTYKEYELLKCLLLNRGKVFTREALLDKVWGYDNYAGTRTVDIHIQRLRSKLGGAYSDMIQTVRNVGYSFAGDKT